VFTDDTKCCEDFSPLKTRKRDLKIEVFLSIVPYTAVKVSMLPAILTVCTAIPPNNRNLKRVFQIMLKQWIRGVRAV
jgi:hypothetical protein